MSTEITGGFFLDAETAENPEDAGTWVQVDDRYGKPMTYFEGDVEKPVEILMAGSYSTHYISAERKIQRRPLKNLKNITTEKVRDENLEKVYACTLGWRGLFVGKDEQGNPIPMPLNDHNKAVLYKACPWILNKMAEAIEDHERFLPTA